MEKSKGFKEEIEVPNELKCEIIRGTVKLEGTKGSVSKRLMVPGVEISKVGNKIIISSLRERKKEKKIVGTFKAHLRNMIKGVTKGHIYQLKICSGHFPMNVSISGREFIIKNFLGEKIPRKVKLKDGANVKIDGTIITVEGSDKDIVSQVAADIEKLTRIRNKDLRVFQDGCYIISKDGKEIK